MGLLQPAPAVIGAVSLTAIVGLGTPKESATPVDCQGLRIAHIFLWTPS